MKIVRIQQSTLTLCTFIFFFTLFSISIYLDVFSSTDFFNFLIILGLFFLILTIQIFYFNLNKWSSTIVILEIIFLLFALRIQLFQSSFFLFDTDEVYDFFATVFVINNDLGINSQVPAIQGILNYPGFHIFTIITHYITDTSIEDLVRFLPDFLTLSSPLVLLLSIKKFNGSYKTILIGCVSFSFLFFFLSFHSFYIREAFAFILFGLLIYTFFFLKKDVKNIIILVLLTFALAISHHLTSFIIVIIFLIFSLMYLLEMMVNKDIYHINSYYFLPIIIIFSYWMILQLTPFSILNYLVSDAIQISGGFTITVAVSIYSLLSQYGKMFFLFLYGLIMLIFLFIPRFEYNLKVISLVVSIGLLSLFGFLIAVGRASIPLIPVRFFPFVFFLLFLVLSIQIGRNLPLSKKISFSLWLITFIFLMFNILLINPSLYDEDGKEISGSSASFIFQTRFSSLMFLHQNIPLEKLVYSDFTTARINYAMNYDKTTVDLSASINQSSFVLQNIEEYIGNTKSILHNQSYIPIIEKNRLISLDKIYSNTHSHIFLP